MKKSLQYSKQLTVVIFVCLICFSTSYAQWVWQNPLPTGNDIQGVSFIDANTGTVAAAMGTILHTTNGGLNWTQQTSGTTADLRTVSFSDINNGIIVGSNGTILCTTNGGTNWISQSSGTTNYLYGAFSINANKRIVVGASGTILRTTDGGLNWVPQSSGLTNTLNSVTFTDSNTGTAVGQSGKIIRTTDGGLNWVPQTSGLTTTLNNVSFTDANTGTVVGASGKIIRTTDGGLNWVLQTSGITSTLNGVFFVDANNGTAVGGTATANMILHTSDGGLTWVKQTPGTNLILLTKVSFTDTNNGTVVGTSGTVLHTTNGGGTWSLLSSNATLNVLNAVSFSDANSGTAVGQAGTIIRTDDGGLYWKPQISGTIENFTGVSFADANTGTAVTAGGRILHTVDGGDNWLQQSTGITCVLRGVSFIDANIGTVIGNDNSGNSVILRTTDGGANWISQIPSGTTYTLMAVAFTDDMNGTVVGFNGIILRTTNGGVNWNLQTSGLTNHLVSVSFTDANNGTVGGFNGTILHTTNGGINWISQTSGVTSALNGVSFIDANNGIITCESGSKILYTTNGGANWIPQSSGTSSALLLYGCSFKSNCATVIGAGGTILRWNNFTVYAPIAPTNLIGIPDTNFVNLTWSDNSNNESGFIIARKIGDSLSVEPFAIIDTVLADLTAYIDSGLTPNTTYTYKICAYNNGGESDYSNLVQITTLALPVTTFQVSVDVTNGWNMVSVPGTHPINMHVDTWWSGRNPLASVYKWTGTYAAVTNTTPKEGYWMLHTDAKTYNTGDEWPAGGIQIVAHDPIPVTTGWNMIGGYDGTPLVSALTTTPPGLIVPGTVYGWSGSYANATNLNPGYGYWVLINAPGGVINVPSSLAKGTLAKEDNKETWGKIIVTDATGKKYTLYAVDGEVNLNSYQMPPLPPAGCFDVRFGSGRKAEYLNKASQTIEMTGLEYPVTVMADNVTIKVQDETGKVINKRIKSGEEVKISESHVSKLLVSENLVPDVYSLDQNYPNPFNPATLIQFTLPEDVNNVSLIIYDALGQKVAEILNGNLQAGYYKYNWNAGNFASGIYICQLRTEKFVSTKKMTLLK